MPGKNRQVGVRLTDEEATFLEEVQLDNAATPSDKLRAIIDEARRRKLGTQSYPTALDLCEDLLGPTGRILRRSQNTQEVHSELVSRLLEWVPECMAYLVASNGRSTDLELEQLKEIEAALARRVGVLMQSVLQLAIPQQAPLYDNTVLRRQLSAVLELAEVVQERHQLIGEGVDD